MKLGKVKIVAVRFDNDRALQIVEFFRIMSKKTIHKFHF